MSAEEIRTTFADTLAAEPLPPVRFILYFMQGSDELTDDSKAMLPKIFQTIKSRESTDIVISGHTDTVGEKEYNYTLSLERAKAILKFSLSMVRFLPTSPLPRTGKEIP